MMRGRQLEQAQSPVPEAWSLAILSEKLKVGPPALDEIMACLQNMDTTETFANLVTEFLPGQEKKVMSEPRRRRIYRFCYLFGKKYYPLPANTDCSIADWVQGMPVELLGLSYHTYHGLEMRPGYLLLLSLVVYPYEGDERDEEDDSVPFDPMNLPTEKYKPSARDIAWLKGLVASLAVDGEWVAPMGFAMVKVADNRIELREAKDTPEVKETIRRTLLIAKRVGIVAEFTRNGRTSLEKLNGARVPLLDKVLQMVGGELAGRIPPEGWRPEALHRMTDKTKYDGVGDFADWACSHTGCVMLDCSYENCEYVEGNGEPLFKWTRNNVETLTEQWPKVQRLRGKIDHVVEWLEADPVNHFKELLNSLLQCKPAKNSAKEKGMRLYDPFEHLCPLDQEGQEEEDEEDEN